MPTIPNNQLINIEIRTRGSAAAGGSGARPIDFVTHWRRTATVLTVPKAPIDTAYQAAIVVPMGAALNVTYLQQFNTVRFINDATDPPVSFSHAVAGAIAGDRMSTIDAAYLLLRSGLKGRKYRGSKHLGPMSEADSTAGTDDLWNAAALARLATLAAALLAGFTDATGNVWVPSIVSRRPPAQYTSNPTTTVANDVTAVLVNKRIGTMRGRRVPSLY